SSADALIYPSRTETLCMALLEAMTAGCPVVAARSGGIPDIVTDGLNGYLFEPTADVQAAMPAAGGAIAFADGIPKGAKKQEPNSYRIPAGELSGRFFRMGDKVWMNRCNIYREEFTLKTMTAARRKWRHKLSQCQFQENRAVATGNDCKQCSQ
ncbi:glycosyltransferase, partial [Nostoc sp.]